MVFFGLVATCAHAASFDCRLAKTPVEKAICSDPKLSTQDEQMAAIYKQVLSEVPASMQDQIRIDQRNWVKTTAQHCQAAKILVGCLQDLYANQLIALQQRVVTRLGIKFVTQSITLMSPDTPDDARQMKQLPDEEENPGFGTEHVSWPQALSDDPSWKAWNAAVLAEVRRFSGCRTKDGSGWSKSCAAGSEDTITSSLGTVTPQLVTVSATNDEMGHGAAHPNEISEQFHWMLKEQRPLKTADVFQSAAAWQPMLDRFVRVDLKKQLGDDYQSYATSPADFTKTLHSVIFDPKNWTFTKGGIDIDFPEYSITPRAQPVDTITIPWSLLQADLIPGFVRPQ